jgi:tellurite resistance-related uncharacterized protein
VADDAVPAILPADAVLVRTTSEFDETTTPQGLLRAHHLAADVWGVVEVRSGALRFVFEDARDDAARTVTAGDRQVIPPATPHHIEFTEPVRFVIEFHRPRGTVPA